ncbi:hypothetical protein [Natrinema halophilum]|uniref:Uncharacterized protein n=1 Tax=Natrinema halophilum TaxID=1699371 RepID=A0A7D5KLW4_9EURY|nr:hypothetical protein [Natrinema halophilum]QLG50298.1 hypothetical protein HYG82_16345 [Natrinema halophilum]
MNATLDPETRSRVIVGLIVGYFVVVAYTSITNDPLAATVAALGFGSIAIVVGVALYDRGEKSNRTLSVAAACFVGGGLLQFVAVITGAALVDFLSSLLVFLGVGCYAYAIWRAN